MVSVFSIIIFLHFMLLTLKTSCLNDSNSYVTAIYIEFSTLLSCMMDLHVPKRLSLPVSWLYNPLLTKPDSSPPSCLQ